MRKGLLSFIALALGCAVATAGQDEDPKALGKPLSEWLKILEDPKSPARQQAVTAITNLGPKAKAAVPALIKMLQDKNDTVARYYITNALGRIGPEAKDAIPILIEGLADGNTYGSASYALGQIGPEAAMPLAKALQHMDQLIRQRAAAALQQLGPKAEPALPALIEAWKDPALRTAVAIAMQKIGPAATPHFIKALEDKNVDAVETAISHLGQLKAKEASAALNAIFKRPEPTLHVSAAAALWQLGEKTDENFQRLFDALESKDDQVKLRALGSFYLVGKDGVAPLIKRLEDKAPEVRRRAVQGLGKLGTNAAGALPELTKALKDPDALVRTAALDVIRNTGKDGVPALFDALQLPDAPLQIKAITLLRASGFDNLKKAIPKLTELLKDKDGLVRLEAAQALVGANALKPEEFVDRLTDTLLEESAKAVRYQAIVYLANYYYPASKTPLHQRATEVVQVALKDKDPGLRLRAAQLIVNRIFFSPQADVSQVLPVLVQGLGDKDKADRELAVTTLSRLGARAQPAVNALRDALTDESPLVRQYSVHTLGVIGLPAKGAVPQLAKALEDPVDNVRHVAAQALGNFGAEAAPATKALVAALKDKQEGIRMSAVETLGKIGLGAKEAVPALIEIAKEGTGTSVPPKTGFPFMPGVAQPYPRFIPPGSAPRMAVESLLRIGVDAPELAPTFLALMKSKDPVVRRMGASSLGILGKSVVADLIQGTKDQDPQLRSLCLEALGSLGIGGKETALALAAALTDEEAAVREQAALALSRLGAEAAPALGQVQKILTTAGDRDLRAFAAQVLGDIGPAAAGAADDLLKASTDDDPQVRQWTAIALGRIGAATTQVLARLKALQQDDDPFVRRSATRALTQLQSDKK